MIPRAEIVMVIMQQGQQLGDWAVSSEVFAVMTMVLIATCILSPLVLRPLLKSLRSLKNFSKSMKYLARSKMLLH